VAESQVIIHNKLGQKVDLPLLSEAGTPVTVPLASRANLGPIPRARVGRFARKLEEKGHIRIHTVTA